MWWDRGLVAAGVLAERDVAAAWPSLWRAIIADPEFGRRFVLRYTHWHDSHRGGPLADGLTEAQLADLFLWMERRFPRRNDPRFPKAAHAVSDREQLAEWRDTLLRELAGRGTPVALHELRRIDRVLKDPERFFWLINRAEKAAMAGSWPKPTAAQVLALASDRAATMVESESQLMDAVLGSIERYARRLRGEIPIAFTLWNNDRPKDEESLSDALADHLRVDLAERGVVASREVQIRRGRGDRPGERNDIHVDAVARGDAPGRFRVLTVVVEVKGCWNDEARTAMKTQLRDRYLKESHCQHGLSLVGWFLCDQWTKKDNRRAATIRNIGNSLDAARAFFDRQAQQLSTESVTVRAAVVDATLR